MMRDARWWSGLSLNPSKAAIAAAIGLSIACVTPPARAQERRDREPNSVYADRRAKLAAQVDAPIVLFGFTGREESAQTYMFEQEENFYYLTGHNEEGAALLIRSEEHTSELQSPCNLVCRLLLEKKKKKTSPAMMSGLADYESH